MTESKNIPVIAFLAMLFSLTLLCIFLYFGGCEMTCCKKIVLAVVIGIITSVISLCVLCCCECKPRACQEPLYVEDAGVYIIYKGKKKHKFCCVQYYESIAEIEGKSKATRIFITDGTKIDKELFDFLKDKEHEFSVHNSGTEIHITGECDEKGKSDGGN